VSFYLYPEWWTFAQVYFAVANCKSVPKAGPACRIIFPTWKKYNYRPKTKAESAFLKITTVISTKTKTQKNKTETALGSIPTDMLLAYRSKCYHHATDWCTIISTTSVMTINVGIGHYVHSVHKQTLWSQHIDCRLTLPPPHTTHCANSVE